MSWKLKPSVNGQLDQVTIKDRLTGLNDYINAERTNKFKAAKMKTEAEDIVTLALLRAEELGTLHSHDCPCELWITWVEPNRRRDLDNISFATKFIQDAMVRAGVFPDDGSKYIQLLHHTIAFDSNNPRIEITIRERRSHEG